MSEQKVTYEIKLHNSVRILLWVFAFGLILNALPTDQLVPSAFAELSSNPTITLNVRLTEGLGGIDLDD